METFKLLNYKGNNYEVGTYRTIKKDGKVLNIIYDHDGYCNVSTHDFNQQWRSTGVHRLVAMAYCKGRSEKRNEVNHIDYNRQNNYYKNLEWVSHCENIKYSMPNHARLFGNKNPNYGNHKLSEKYKLDPELSKKSKDVRDVKMEDVEKLIYIIKTNLSSHLTIYHYAVNILWIIKYQTQII